MPPPVGRSRIAALCGEIYGIYGFFKWLGVGQIFAWHAPYLTRPSPSAYHCRTLAPRCATANRATSRVVWPAGSRAMRRAGCVAYEGAQAGKKHAGQVPMAYQKFQHRERVYRHGLERTPYRFRHGRNWYGGDASEPRRRCASGRCRPQHMPYEGGSGGETTPEPPSSASPIPQDKMP